MIIGEFSDTFVPIYDGVGRVVKAYCDTLSEMGEKVYAVVPMDSDMGYRGDWGFEVLDFNSVELPNNSTFRLGMSAFDKHFRKRLKAVNLDICHAHDPGIAGQIAVNYAKKHNVPLVGTFHSKYYDDVLKITHSKGLAKIGADYVSSFYNKCDEVWAVSEITAEALKSYGCKKEIQVMPNGTALRELDLASIPVIREKYALPDDGTSILLFVGQQSWKKNILRILESAAILKKEDVKFRLVFAGRGPDEHKIKTKTEELGLSERTVFTGHILNVRELDVLYSISTLFVFPSIYDNAPMVLREAANMGTPGVLVRGTCAAEVIDDRVNGLLAEDDSADMARVIKEALADKEFLSKLGVNAKATIPQPWKGKIMEDVLSRYMSLVNSKA